MLLWQGAGEGAGWSPGGIMRWAGDVMVIIDWNWIYIKWSPGQKNLFLLSGEQHGISYDGDWDHLRERHARFGPSSFMQDAGDQVGPDDGQEDPVDESEADVEVGAWSVVWK